MKLIERMDNTFAFPQKSNLNKNRSILSVGGLWETDAPNGTCSELPSPPPEYINFAREGENNQISLMIYLPRLIIWIIDSSEMETKYPMGLGPVFARIITYREVSADTISFNLKIGYW
jgi:hypothetical protein